MLTTAQLTTLKAAIAANPTWNNQPQDTNGAAAIAADLNALASPSFTVWRASVTLEEIMFSTEFNWARVDNLSVGKARIWEWLFRFGSINAGQANIRVGIDSTWVGTQADLDVRAAVYVVCKRLATVGEKIYATGTGSNAVPAILGFEGTISTSEVRDAREMS